MYTSSAGSGLEWENFVVLGLVQALVGFVTPNLVGVSVTANRDRVAVHFKVRQLNPDVEIDLDSITSDLREYIGNDRISVESTVDVGDYWAPWEGREKRAVYHSLWTSEEWDAHKPAKEAQMKVHGSSPKTAIESGGEQSPRTEKAMVEISGFGEDEFLAWSLATPFLSQDEVASILGIAPEELGAGEWPATRDQVEQMLDRFTKYLLERAGAVDYFAGLVAVRE